MRMERKLAVFLAAILLGSAATAEHLPGIFEISADAVPETPLDKIIAAAHPNLRCGQTVCSDAVFVRRAYLDLIGTLPTAGEARRFIEDLAPGKRAALVDRLLERPEYADYWAMRWGDLLRIKAEFPVNLWPNAAQAYHRWVWESMRDNKPYDRFVREMLTSNGSNFRVGPVNFYRAMQDRTPEGIAASVALTFMGARVDGWEREKLRGMAAFFSQVGYKPTREWKEEIVYWDVHRADAAPAAPGATGAAVRVELNAPEGARPSEYVFPDGKVLGALPEGKDPRAAFADWLISPGNKWFNANIVNRVWFWLMGRGIIHEPDDIRPDNPPSNPQLLDYLCRELAERQYDLRHICRLVLNSRAYQSSVLATNAPPPQSGELYAFYQVRRLDAEVLIDAVNRVTGAVDLYTSAIPEPFTFIPDNKPAISIADGSITSPFLELFGRPARATGMADERVNKPSATQRMHMLNSSHIQRKLEESPKLKALMGQKREQKEIAVDLYLTILSRYPTDEELKNAEDYAKSGVVKGREAWIDLAWALINSDEFMYRH